MHLFGIFKSQIYAKHYFLSKLSRNLKHTNVFNPWTHLGKGQTDIPDKKMCSNTAHRQQVLILQNKLRVFPVQNVF